MTEILPNTTNDVSSRGCTNATLAQFKGLPRQVVININDGYRPIVMDGSTLGGKFKSASLDELNAVKKVAITKSQADGWYLSKTEAATGANKLSTARTIAIDGAVTGTATAFDGTANITINTTSVDASRVKGTLTVDTTGKAAKATQDANGNVIDTTYATAIALSTGLAGKANKTHTHAVADVTNLQATLDGKIPKTGNRGALAGYSTSAVGTTVDASAKDSQYATSGAVTVKNGATGQTWTKVVKMSAGTVTLESNWAWVDGEAPELSFPCLLICHWNNDKGIAGVVKGAA